MIDQPFKEFFENLNKTIDDYVDISDKILECADLAVLTRSPLPSWRG